MVATAITIPIIAIVIINSIKEKPDDLRANDILVIFDFILFFLKV